MSLRSKNETTKIMIQFFEQKLFSNFVLPSHRCSNFGKRANQISAFENNFEYFLNISIYEILIDNIHLFFQSQLNSNLSCDINMQKKETRKVSNYEHSEYFEQQICW